MNSNRDIYLNTKERLVIQKTQLLKSDDWTDKRTDLEQATDTDFLELNVIETDQEQRSKQTERNWNETKRDNIRPLLAELIQVTGIETDSQTELTQKLIDSTVLGLILDWYWQIQTPFP